MIKSTKTVTGFVYMCAGAVWKELQKENKDYFEAYERNRVLGKVAREAETQQRIQKMLSDSSQQNAP